ncbi:Cocosin 1 [Camellia lanceoleosa]|uniref:Cocosin 1 n=1 Tax=Camellia lanceoleosa TaxID=1840588 RepID=A0ACC0H0B9_9ERIC|nr:Cocosin 1 [Camellia lanceoleosa]
MLVYVLQGQGILGTAFPGCPETYQSFRQTEEGRKTERSSRDQYQKIHHIRRGDIVALPARVAHWAYNDDSDQLVLVRFFLAGNSRDLQQGSLREQEQMGQSILQAFDTDILAEVFNVNMETARRVQNEDDKRGFIVRVERELQVARPRRSQEEEEEEREYWSNGLEETICTMRITENIADPERADVYTAQGGRTSTLNGHNLPILRNIQLSAERGVLYKNGIFAPHWNINTHSIMYVTRGSGRIQIVGNSNRPAFDGQVRQGQLLIIPQNFAVLKQAGDEGLEWISEKTNDRAMISPLWKDIGYSRNSCGRFGQRLSNF